MDSPDIFGGFAYRLLVVGLCHYSLPTLTNNWNGPRVSERVNGIKNSRKRPTPKYH
jgi:hypothetical protein